MSYPAPAYAPAATASHGYLPAGHVPNGYAPNGSAPRGVAAPPRPAGSYASPAAATGARYRDAELASAAPGQLVVLLFDKCLLTVRRAAAAFAAGDIEARVGHLGKAVDMVAELRGSLDFDAPGAAAGISRQLDALYAWTLGELFTATREQTPARLDPVLRVLGDLRDAFAGAQAQLAAEGAAGRGSAALARSA